ARPGFTWSDVVGRTIISFAEAPTPWQCMLTVLRTHGVDPAAVRIRRDLLVPDAIAAFRAGEAEFLETGQPMVEGLLAEGAALVRLPARDPPVGRVREAAAPLRGPHRYRGGRASDGVGGTPGERLNDRGPLGTDQGPTRSVAANDGRDGML